MLLDLWNIIRDYFKNRWPTVQWLFALGSLYFTASILGYEYLRWEYGLASEIRLYLRSYLFREITVITLTLAITGLLFSVVDRVSDPAKRGRWPAAMRKHGHAIVRRGALLGLVLCVAVPAMISLVPHRAKDISILFLDDPGTDFDQSALVYLIYALNQRQRQWYFHVEFDVFNKNALTTEEQHECEGDLAALCYAEKAGAGRPLIAITTQPLVNAHFWQNRGGTSVITTADWKPYAPPSMYEYLIYLLLVQSIAVHLNTQCSGLPATAFRESRTAFGDALAFDPRRYAMKAEVLAAHLLPWQKERLLNCFGADYLNSASSLLSMEWLRSDTVAKTLERDFGVRIDVGSPQR